MHRHFSRSVIGLQVYSRAGVGVTPLRAARFFILGACMSRLKVCRRCGQSKPLEAFFRKAKGRDGRQAVCKVCQRELKQERESVALEFNARQARSRSQTAGRWYGVRACFIGYAGALEDQRGAVSFNDVYGILPAAFAHWGTIVGFSANGKSVELRLDFPLQDSHGSSQDTILVNAGRVVVSEKTMRAVMGMGSPCPDDMAETEAAQVAEVAA